MQMKPKDSKSLSASTIIDNAMKSITIFLPRYRWRIATCSTFNGALMLIKPKVQDHLILLCSHLKQLYKVFI